MSHQPKTLIYIAQTGVSVFDSQVIQYLYELSKIGFFDRIILLAGVTQKREWAKTIERYSKREFQLIIYKQYPGYSFFRKLQEREFTNIFERILIPNTVIHIRGQELGAIIKEVINESALTNVKILSDLRGVYEEFEIYLKGKMNPVKYSLKMHFKRSRFKTTLTSSDHISCVSNALLEYVQQKCPQPIKRISVNHSGAGSHFIYSAEHRLEIRESLRLSEKDKLLVFMTGGDGEYQNTQSLIEILLEKEFKVLNLSKRSVKGAINQFVNYNDVPKYLSAADISLVYRNSDVVNHVASPVKFSEYVACGLPIISNGSVKLINDYIEITRFGRIVTDFAQITENLVDELLGIDRNRISEYGIKNFGMKTVIEHYKSVYSQLIS